MMLKILEEVEKEYRDFKDKILESPPENIWEKCHQIYFYSNIYEYFAYNTEIPVIIIEALSDYDNIIAECWQLYLKEEHFSIGSWNDISILLEKCAEHLREQASPKSYMEFEKIICDKLYGRLDNVKIQSRTIVKNNSVERQAINIIEEGCNVSPSIYLESYYDDYIEGADIDEIADKIIEFYNRNCYKNRLDMKEILDWDKVSSQIIYKLINASKNEELLQDIPYVSWCDLAIVFCVMLKNDENGMASITVNQSLCKLWGKSTKELMTFAVHNTASLFPPTCMSLPETIEKISDLDIAYSSEESDLKVISNASMTNGAIAILYPGMLSKVAEELQSDFYIIPSSIHESIVIPAVFYDAQEILDMVKCVNQTVVSETDFLSNSIYYYDCSSQVIHMCSNDAEPIQVNMGKEVLLKGNAAFRQYSKQ